MYGPWRPQLFSFGGITSCVAKTHQPDHWPILGRCRKTSQSTVKIFSTLPKCDHYSKGVDIIVGRTVTPPCLILDYIRLLPTSSWSILSDWSWHLSPGSLVSSGDPLPSPPRYASHSFRIGAATTVRPWQERRIQ